MLYMLVEIKKNKKIFLTFGDGSKSFKGAAKRLANQVKVKVGSYIFLFLPPPYLKYSIIWKWFGKILTHYRHTQHKNWTGFNCDANFN